MREQNERNSSCVVKEDAIYQNEEADSDCEWEVTALRMNEESDANTADLD